MKTKVVFLRRGIMMPTMLYFSFHSVNLHTDFVVKRDFWCIFCTKQNSSISEVSTSVHFELYELYCDKDLFSASVVLKRGNHTYSEG